MGVEFIHTENCCVSCLISMPIETGVAHKRLIAPLPLRLYRQQHYYFVYVIFFVPKSQVPTTFALPTLSVATISRE